MNRIILYINATLGCNLDCTKCYLRESVRNSRGKLEDEALIRLLKDPYLQQSDKRIMVVWEGGEVALAGEERLRHFCTLTRELLPESQQTMVANLVVLPHWLIQITKDFFDSKFETTYAPGEKQLYGGDEAGYRKKYEANLIKAVNHELSVSVNVEVNQGTYERGVDEMAEFMVRSGAKIWDFDIAIGFDRFLSAQRYNSHAYPLLEPSLGYEYYYQYIKDLVLTHDQTFVEHGIDIAAVRQMMRGARTQLYAVQKTHEMFTLNPNGDLTTNPMWSDMQSMLRWNIFKHSLEDVLKDPQHRAHTRWELMERVRPCRDCEYYSMCRGGPSYAPIFDGQTEECVGGRRLWGIMKEYRGPMRDTGYLQCQRRDSESTITKTISSVNIT